MSEVDRDSVDSSAASGLPSAPASAINGDSPPASSLFLPLSESAVDTPLTHPTPNASTFTNELSEPVIHEEPTDVPRPLDDHEKKVEADIEQRDARVPEIVVQETNPNDELASASQTELPKETSTEEQTVVDGEELHVVQPAAEPEEPFFRPGDIFPGPPQTSQTESQDQAADSVSEEPRDEFDLGEVDLAAPLLRKRNLSAHRSQQVSQIRSRIQNPDENKFLKWFEYDDENLAQDVVHIGEVAPEIVEEQEIRLEELRIVNDALHAEREQVRREERLRRERQAKAAAWAQREALLEAEKKGDVAIDEREMSRREALQKEFQRLEDALRNEAVASGAVLQTEYGNAGAAADGRDASKVDGTESRIWKIDTKHAPQPIQLRLVTMRAVKDKLPRGRYVMLVSLYDRLGGAPMRYTKLDPTSVENEERQDKDSDGEGDVESGNAAGSSATRRLDQARSGLFRWSGASNSVFHGGRFFDVNMQFHESVFLVTPADADIPPQTAIVFELFLLRSGRRRPKDQVVAWGAFPAVNGRFNVIEGRFKLPMILGEYDPSVQQFARLEKIYRENVDMWIGNLYFEVYRLPKFLPGQNEFEVELLFRPDYLRDLALRRSGSGADGGLLAADGTDPENVPDDTEDLAEAMEKAEEAANVLLLKQQKTKRTKFFDRLLRRRQTADAHAAAAEPVDEERGEVLSVDGAAESALTSDTAKKKERKTVAFSTPDDEAELDEPGPAKESPQLLVPDQDVADRSPHLPGAVDDRGSDASDSPTRIGSSKSSSDMAFRQSLSRTKTDSALLRGGLSSWQPPPRRQRTVETRDTPGEESEPPEAGQLPPSSVASSTTASQTPSANVTPRDVGSSAENLLSPRTHTRKRQVAANATNLGFAATQQILALERERSFVLKREQSQKATLVREASKPASLVRQQSKPAMLSKQGTFTSVSSVRVDGLSTGGQGPQQMGSSEPPSHPQEASPSPAEVPKPASLLPAPSRPWLLARTASKAAVSLMNPNASSRTLLAPPAPVITRTSSVSSATSSEHSVQETRPLLQQTKRREPASSLLRPSFARSATTGQLLAPKRNKGLSPRVRKSRKRPSPIITEFADSDSETESDDDDDDDDEDESDDGSEDEEADGQRASGRPVLRRRDSRTAFKQPLTLESRSDDGGNQTVPLIVGQETATTTVGEESQPDLRPHTANLDELFPSQPLPLGTAPGSTSGSGRGDEIAAGRNAPKITLDMYRMSVAPLERVWNKSTISSEKFAYIRRALVSDLGLHDWRRGEFWWMLFIILLMLWVRLFPHYFGTWLYLQAFRTPVSETVWYPYTVIFKYRGEFFSPGFEVGSTCAGMLFNMMLFVVFIFICGFSQWLLGSFPDLGSRMLIAFGFGVLCDPLLIVLVDNATMEYEYSESYRLQRYYAEKEKNGLIGVVLTLFLYSQMMLATSFMLYHYALRLHMNGRMMDIYYRIHGQEDNFFVPHDLEVSMPQFETIVRRARHWRGEAGAMRKTAVRIYEEPMPHPFLERLHDLMTLEWPRGYFARVRLPDVRHIVLSAEVKKFARRTFPSFTRAEYHNSLAQDDYRKILIAYFSRPVLYSDRVVQRPAHWLSSAETTEARNGCLRNHHERFKASQTPFRQFVDNVKELWRKLTSRKKRRMRTEKKRDQEHASLLYSNKKSRQGRHSSLGKRDDSDNEDGNSDEDTWTATQSASEASKSRIEMETDGILWTIDNEQVLAEALFFEMDSDQKSALADELRRFRFVRCAPPAPPIYWQARGAFNNRNRSDSIHSVLDRRFFRTLRSVHVVLYTWVFGGARELYRHFVRGPDGVLAEVFEMDREARRRALLGHSPETVEYWLGVAPQKLPEVLEGTDVM